MKTIKYLQENLEANLNDLGFDDGFLNMTPKAEAATTTKIGKLDFMKSKNICTSKDTIKRVKRQPTEWEKIFANPVFDKAPVSRICKKKLLQLNNKKAKNSIQK